MEIKGHFAKVYKISRRENECLFYALLGLKNDEISHIMNIRFKTVKFHLTNIFKKLRCKSRQQLFLFMPSQVFSTQINKSKLKIKEELKKLLDW